MVLRVARRLGRTDPSGVSFIDVIRPAESISHGVAHFNVTQKCNVTQAMALDAAVAAH
jgi:hypothetical protein